MKMLQEYCHEHEDIDASEMAEDDPYYYDDESAEPVSFDDTDKGPLQRPSTRCSLKSIV